jgi:nicotinate phosphoribosyltransferase
MVDPTDALTRKRGFPGDYQELLSPVFRNGQQIDPEESLRAIRERTLQQDKLFHHSILRFDNPHRYPVGLESGLYDLKAQMIVNGRASKGK